jgi:hypothetical protein
MATHAPNYGRASALPLSAVLGSIPSYPRPVIERLVARLIDYLDTQDGDPDLELDDPPEDGDHDEEQWQPLDS